MLLQEKGRIVFQNLTLKIQCFTLVWMLVKNQMIFGIWVMDAVIILQEIEIVLLIWMKKCLHSEAWKRQNTKRPKQRDYLCHEKKNW